MAEKFVLTLERTKTAILTIVQLIATWVNGVLGARAPKAVAMVFNPVVAVL
jgi:hypothetical protein